MILMNTFLFLLLSVQTVQKDVPVAMKDGTKLATDIYLPAGDGPFPALFVRSPYNKNGEAASAKYFSSRGYAFVAQDTRGRYGSEDV